MCRLVAAYTLDERYPPVRVASACEMILFKLQRYQRDARSRSDGMRDDSEWNDILGMLKVQGPALDLVRLERWADALDGQVHARQPLPHFEGDPLAPDPKRLVQGDFEFSEGGYIGRPFKDGDLFEHFYNAGGG